MILFRVSGILESVTQSLIRKGRCKFQSGFCFNLLNDIQIEFFSSGLLMSHSGWIVVGSASCRNSVQFGPVCLFSFILG